MTTDTKYVHVGEIEPWMRAGAKGERYLAVAGSYKNPIFKRILSVRKTKTWRHWQVRVKGSEVVHSCWDVTKIYRKETTGGNKD